MDDSEFKKITGLYTVFILALEKVALQNGYDLSYCIEVAWHEVKNRKGTMFNGSFVKDGNK